MRLPICDFCSQKARPQNPPKNAMNPLIVICVGAKSTNLPPMRNEIAIYGKFSAYALVSNMRTLCLSAARIWLLEPPESIESQGRVMPSPIPTTKQTSMTRTRALHRAGYLAYTHQVEQAGLSRYSLMSWRRGAAACNPLSCIYEASVNLRTTWPYPQLKSTLILSVFWAAASHHHRRVSRSIDASLPL